MENKKTKLTISGTAKKSIKNIEIAKRWYTKASLSENIKATQALRRIENREKNDFQNYFFVRRIQWFVPGYSFLLRVHESERYRGPYSSVWDRVDYECVQIVHGCSHRYIQGLTYRTELKIPFGWAGIAHLIDLVSGLSWDNSLG